MDFSTLASSMPIGVFDSILDMARPRTLKEYAKMSTLNHSFKIMLDDYIKSMECADIFASVVESFGHMTIDEVREEYFILTRNLMDRLEILNYIIYDARDIGEFLYFPIYEQGKKFTYFDLAVELTKSDMEIYKTFVASAANTSEVDENAVRQIKETLTKENIQIYDDLWNAWHLVAVISSNDPLNRWNDFLEKQDIITHNMTISQIADIFKNMPLWRKYMIEA